MGLVKLRVGDQEGGPLLPCQRTGRLMKDMDGERREQKEEQDEPGERAGDNTVMLD